MAEHVTIFKHFNDLLSKTLMACQLKLKGAIGFRDFYEGLCATLSASCPANLTPAVRVGT